MYEPGQVSITGTWVGGMQINWQWEFVRITFQFAEGEISATIDLPHRRTTGQAEIALDGPLICLELQTDGAQSAVFTGRLQGDTITGEVRLSGDRGTFSLANQPAYEVRAYDGLIGHYALDTQRTLLVARDNNRRTCFPRYYFDGKRLTRIYPLTQTRFMSEDGETLEFILDSSGRATGFNYHAGALQIYAPRIQVYQEVEVSYTNDSVTLAGTVLLPPGDGPHPAVVMIHGSGHKDREPLRMMADHFARHGIAVLISDKRGTGSSTGDWQNASLHDLAGDTLAGVRLLQTRNDIDPHRVGLWGLSQGGWIAPMVAIECSDVAFVILVGSSGVSPAKQELYRMEQEMRMKGGLEEHIEIFMGAWQTFYRWLLTGESYSEFKLMRKRALSMKEEDAFLPPAPTDCLDNTIFVNLGFDFDPAPYLARLKCPILAVWGDLDKIVPVSESVDILQQALDKAENKDYTIRVFPRGNHNLLQAEQGSWIEWNYLRDFVPGFFETMTNWVLERVTNFS